MRVVFLVLLFVAAVTARKMFRRLDPSVIEVNKQATESNSDGLLVVTWMGSDAVVCADGIDAQSTVDVACGGSGTVSAPSSNVPTNVEFVVTNAKCSGGEADLGKCQWDQGKPSECNEAVVAKCSKKREIFWSFE